MLTIIVVSSRFAEHISHLFDTMDYYNQAFLSNGQLFASPGVPQDMVRVMGVGDKWNGMRVLGKPFWLV